MSERERMRDLDVVPHAGTWIEICKIRNKFNGGKVVPHAGTWIEICFVLFSFSSLPRRSPRGNVD